MSHVQAMKQVLKDRHMLVTNNSRRELGDDEIRRRYGLSQERLDPCLLTKQGLLLLIKAHGLNVDTSMNRKDLCVVVRTLLREAYMESPHAEQNIRNLARTIKMHEEATPLGAIKKYTKGAAAALTALLLLGAGARKPAQSKALAPATAGRMLALPPAMPKLPEKSVNILLKGLPKTWTENRSKALMPFDEFILKMEKKPQKSTALALYKEPRNKKSKALALYKQPRDKKSTALALYKQPRDKKSTMFYKQPKDKKSTALALYKKPPVRKLKRLPLAGAAAAGVAVGAAGAAYILKKSDYTDLDKVIQSIGFADQVVVIMPQSPSKSTKALVGTLLAEMSPMLSVLRPTREALEFFGVADMHLPHIFALKDGEKVYEVSLATPRKTLMVDAIGGLLGCRQPREPMPSRAGSARTPADSFTLFSNRFNRERGVFIQERNLVRSNLGKKRGRALVVVLGKVSADAVRARYASVPWVSVLKGDRGLVNDPKVREADIAVLRGDEVFALRETDPIIQHMRLALWGALEC